MLQISYRRFRIYDGRGNLTSDGTNTYTFDVENRLLTASAPTAVSLSYDPLGRLQQSVAGTAVTQYLYDGTALVAELDGSGNVLRRYAEGPGADNPLVWYEGPGLTVRNYLHTDERGSVIAATNNTGAATIYTYGPYGEPSTWIGSRFRYTGQIAIPEAQLYYFKARVYSPKLGRFLQTDPSGFDADMNLYAFVNDDPTDRVDADGLRDIFVGGFFDPTTKLVKNFALAWEKNNPGTEVKYVSWRQASALRQLINSTPLGEPVHVIGHSYGATAAVKAVAAATRPVDLLITADPVGRLNPGDASKNIASWINIVANPSDRNLSDFIAWIGGKPGNIGSGKPTENYVTNDNHADFQEMMQTHTTSGGTAADRLKQKAGSNDKPGATASGWWVDGSIIHGSQVTGTRIP